jgi:hypothetical protein
MRPDLQAAGGSPGAIRVYSHLLSPREDPDYDRRAVKPPDWDTRKHRTQFTTLVSLNFGHYFLKEGTYTLISAETARRCRTARSLTRSRAAPEAVRRRWYGDASIYSRWGQNVRVRQHGQPGMMHTPSGCCSTTIAGGRSATSLPTSAFVCGNLPTDEGDHFTDALLD